MANTTEHKPDNRISDMVDTYNRLEKLMEYVDSSPMNHATRQYVVNEIDETKERLMCTVRNIPDLQGYRTI